MALPPLGTGNLQFPPEEVATVMLREVERFDQTHVGTTLKDVFIVVYEKDLSKLAVSYIIFVTNLETRNMIAHYRSIDQPCKFITRFYKCK